jgi:hypothetical protein
MLRDKLGVVDIRSRRVLEVGGSKAKRSEEKEIGYYYKQTFVYNKVTQNTCHQTITYVIDYF